jgi:hypothetical protein
MTPAPIITIYALLRGSSTPARLVDSDARTSRSAYAVACSRSAWEGNQHISTFVEHLLVANRPGGAAVSFPVGGDRFDLATHQLGYFVNECICARSVAMDNRRARKAALTQNLAQRVPHSLPIGEAPATCRDDPQISSSCFTGYLSLHVKRDRALRIVHIALNHPFLVI